MRKQWEEFSDVTINYDDPDHPDGVIENDWFVFSAGADRINDIWRWFDEHYSRGIYKLMFSDD